MLCALKQKKPKWQISPFGENLTYIKSIIETTSLFLATHLCEVCVRVYSVCWCWMQVYMKCAQIYMYIYNANTSKFKYRYTWICFFVAVRLVTDLRYIPSQTLLVVTSVMGQRSGVDFPSQAIYINTLYISQRTHAKSLSYQLSFPFLKNMVI